MPWPSEANNVESFGMTYIVRVTLEGLLALPAHLPIPQFDSHVITGRQNERLRWVDTNRSDIVGMGLEARNFF